MRKNSFGTSLVEMIVYSALLLTVFTGVFGVFNAVTKYYYAVNTGIDVQQTTVGTTYRLSKDLSEANINSIAIYKQDDTGNGADPYYPRNYPSAGNLGRRGIVFMSPRLVTNESKGITGDVSVNTSTGKVYWNSYICYYLTTDTQDTSKFQLVRKVKRINPAVDTVAYCEYSPDWFATNTTIGSGQIVARGLNDMDIYWWKPTATGTYPNTYINYGLYGYYGNDHTGTTSYTTDLRNRTVCIRITTSKTNRNGKPESIVIDDKIVPMN